MNLSMNVSMDGLEKLDDRAEQAGQELLFLSMVKMETLAKQKAPVDTGILKNRISLSPIKKGASSYTLADGTDYGVHMEYGTSPHHPPIGPLKDWSRRVLGDESAAWAVQKSIAKNGVDAHPFFRPALREVEKKWIPIYKAKVLEKLSSIQ